MGKPGRGGSYNRHKHGNRNRHNSSQGERNDRAPKFNRYELSNDLTLKEDQIGITEYVTPGSGFTGVIKHRISDFQVSEVDLDGVIAKLTDIKPPIPPEDEDSKLTDENGLKSLITTEKFDEISGLKNGPNEAFVLIDVTSLDKTQRTLIHQTIKSTFAGISGTTFDENDKKYIKCSRQTQRNDNRGTKWLWPHEYVYFLLHKDNIDTMQAVATLAPLLSGARVSSLTYAGTKDKRGRTTQWVSIRRRDPTAIVKAAARLPNIHVGNFSFKPQPLKLGQLQGNRFRIALRNVSENDETIDQILQNFKQNGFINYYGLQRFGNHASVPTHEIGRALLKGNFKEACELILKPRDNDIPFMVGIRECWWNTRDAKKALDMFWNKGVGRGVEQHLLAGLVKNGPNDYVNSLENIPRNVRLMYIHSYQSLIWNEIASRRIREHGLKLFEGDLVYVTASSSQEILDDTETVDEANEAADVDADSQPQVNESRFKAMVKQIDTADIESGNYTIFDIVLPLPGHDITYPGGNLFDWYQERLAKDDLSSEKLKQKHKGYSLTGAYRKLLVKPGNFNWTFMKYHNDTDALIQSDIEEIRGETVPVSADDGTLKALILDFALPSSSYATMALREVLKADTSASSQCRLQQSETAKRVHDSIEPSGDGDGDGATKQKLPKLTDEIST